MLEQAVKQLAHRFGLEIGHYRPPGPRRMRMLAKHEIGVVLDVGANLGQYALELRRHGYRGRIVSFEPLTGAFTELARAAAADPDWELHRVALGAEVGAATIGVASNLASSSLLPMLSSVTEATPEVTLVGHEEVDVRTLDSFELDLDVPTLLKLDVQGFEDRVIAGARRTLEQVSLIECEVSVEPLYASQQSLREMLNLLADTGYRLIALEPGFADKSGKILQFDAWLSRSAR
jgi:FkbM family methyltransferase